MRGRVPVTPLLRRSRAVLDRHECLCDSGYWREWEQIERYCLDAARAVRDVKRQADILCGLGWLAIQKDQLDEAAERINTALQLYGQLPDPVGSLRALRYEAMISIKRKDYALACAQLNDLLNDSAETRPTIAEQDRRQTLKWQEMNAHVLLSDVLRELGDDSGAEREAALVLEWARRSVGITREHPLLSLGKLRFQQGRLDEASQYLSECLDICRAENVPLTAADALEQWAEVARLQGDMEAATDRARAALKIYHHLGAGADESRVAESMAKLGHSGFPPALY